MNERTLPLQFWKDLCEGADYPLACVSIDNKFIWVNEAFERLVGYSVSELITKTWIDITEQKDVGGDLASVQSVVNGEIKSYNMSKNYVHKRGNLLPVELSVYRFPSSMLEDLLCFRVHINIKAVTKPELEKLENRLDELSGQLQEKINKYRNGINIINNSENNMGDKWSNGDKVGNNKVTNSDNAIKIMAGALVLIVITVAWLFYYVATANNGGPVTPPSITSPDN